LRSLAVHLRSGETSEILLGAGVFPGAVLERLPAGAVFVITDSNVRSLYAEPLAAAAGGRRITVFAVEAGEASKTRETKARIEDAMLSAGFGRDGFVLAVGGGVVGDLAGFVAATYHRGVPYGSVATSLLSQVDSSVGGKTGVDTTLGKNLIGAFHHPRFVVIDPLVLRTLPPGELANGLAEVAKCGLIADTRLLALLEERAEALLRLDPTVVEEAILRSVRVKMRIVRRDPRESGLRQVLNFGHTIGHALESATSYAMRHGEAVSVGMAVALRLSERVCGFPQAQRERAERILGRLGLPTRVPPGVPAERLAGGTRSDKKAREGRPRYLLLEKPGRPARRGDRSTLEVDPAIVMEALRELGAL
jgi:3-dehydroquinate synthase